MLKRYDIDPAVALAVRAEYRIRKKTLHRLVIGWMVYGMIILWSGLVPVDLLPYFIFPVVIAINVVCWRVWRCPRCGRPFGSRYRVNRCPRCNVVLEADDPPGTAQAAAPVILRTSVSDCVSRARPGGSAMTNVVLEARTMGEAARRKQQGFDGRKLGEDVVGALNADAGGPVWELARGGQQPDHFLVLGAGDESVRAAIITNREAEETPHRIVVQRLYRRGETWLHALIFDPSEEYRTDLYTQLARRAVGVVHGASDEGIDRVQQEIIHSSWPELQENVDRISMDPSQLPQAEPSAESAGNSEPAA